METEIWENIPWYENFYQVSNLGRIKSLERTINRNWFGDLLIKERYIKWRLKLWYVYINLSNYWQQKEFRLHRLVYCTFNKINLKFNKHINCICHKDDNPLNNRLDNLFLGSQKDNMIDKNNKNKQAKWEKNWNSILTKDIVLKIKNDLKINSDFKYIWKKYQIHRTTIYNIAKWRTWQWLQI